MDDAFEEDFESKFPQVPSPHAHAASLKMIVVGNGAVGKTSIIRRFAKGRFTDGYKKTIGVDFLEKRLVLSDGEEVTCMLWDTAGQEEFDAITRSYYRGAGVCAIVFSTTDRRSFEAVGGWMTKVMSECAGIPVVLVQNKIDRLDDAAMSEAEVTATAAKLGLTLFRVSVKSNHNVTEVFEHLAREGLKARSAAPAPALSQPPKALIEGAPGGSSSQDSPGFHVGAPSKVRTGGKKRSWCGM